MRKARRVLVYGDSVALAGVATSLSLDPGCEVSGHCLPVGEEELVDLRPDAVIFELDAVPPAFVYTVSRQLPGLLLIGIDLETNRAIYWSAAGGLPAYLPGPEPPDPHDRQKRPARAADQGPSGLIRMVKS